MKPKSFANDQAFLQGLAMEMAATGQTGEDLLRITVTGSSMRPTLQPGDVILVQPGSALELKPGDLATFLTDAGPITHRIVARAGSDWIAKGDNARRLDATIPAARVVGPVVAWLDGDLERPVRTGARAIWTARLSYLEGRVSERFDPDRRVSLIFKGVNLPFRLMVLVLARPGLPR